MVKKNTSNKFYCCRRESAILTRRAAAERMMLLPLALQAREWLQHGHSLLYTSDRGERRAAAAGKTALTPPPDPQPAPTNTK